MCACVRMCVCVCVCVCVCELPDPLHRIELFVPRLLAGPCRAGQRPSF